MVSRREEQEVLADEDPAASMPNGCTEHGFAPIQGFCRDCSSGICFRCAIGKHRNHNMCNTDELDDTDLEPMLDMFDNKIDQLRDKAQKLLEKTRTQETNSDKLPEIVSYFDQIKAKFSDGEYKEMIINELERNYNEIKNMHFKLEREERED